MTQTDAVPQPQGQPLDQPSRQFVTALARGLDVLDAFVPEGRPLGNQEIAARTGLPKPTVSRLTYTLTSLGYLVQVPGMEKYRLGPRVLGFSQAFSTGVSLSEIADGPMQSLADAMRGTVALGQADGTEMVYVALRRSVSRIMLRQQVGSRIAIHHTAMGMAWLHSLPETVRDVEIARVRPGDPDARARFDALLARSGAEMAAQGYCLALGSWESDINGAATAMRLDDGQGVIALNVGGPAFRLTEADLRGRVGALLLECRDNLLAAGIGRVGLG